MRPLQGVFPPVPTIFTAEGTLDLDRFAQNLQRWNATGLAGYVVLGSNGEFTLLNEREKLALIERARAVTPSEKLLIAGTGCESTQETIALTRAAAHLGADLALVITPHYYSPSYQLVNYVTHFHRVAEASPIPVLAYNMPSFAKVDLSPTTLAEIAQHPNIAGYKESGQNVAKVAEVVAAAPPRFKVLAGSASTYLSARLAGAVGGILALALVAPTACVELDEAIARHDLARALELQRTLLPLNELITTQLGIPAVKAALDLLGWHGGLPRAPLLPLGDAGREKVRRGLELAGLLRATERLQRS